MFKAVYVARFRDGMTREEARSYWTDVHGPLGVDIPGLVRYVQNHMIGSIGPAGIVESGLAFDGYACEWYESRPAFDAAMKTPEWERVVQDGYEVFEMDSLEGMSAVVEERVMRDGPVSPFKVVWFAKFRSGIDRQEANEHWATRHGPIALRAPGIDRYVQNVVIGSLDQHGVGTAAVGFDGFSECWFKDRAAFDEATGSSAWQELVEDGHVFLDMEALVGMSGVVDERVIKA
jgi:uncharacterized protein (TIGR02118 family)